MKTDAEVLLGLLGEDCCCDCCEEEVQARAKQKAIPAHPQMYGKRMLPLDVPVTDQPFVPPLFPERETPQLPEPRHAPIMLPGHAPNVPTGLLYGQTEVPDELGFDLGLMLDDGTLDRRLFGEINHQTRIGRMWSGTSLTSVTYAAAPYALRVSSAYGIAGIPPQTAATPRTDHTFSGVAGGATAPTQAEAEARFLIEVVGFGRCLRGFVQGMKYEDHQVPSIQTIAFQEDYAQHFDGTRDTLPVVNATTSGNLIGVLTNAKIETPTNYVATSGPAGTTNYDSSVIQTVFQPNDTRLRGFRNSWTDANGVFRTVDWIVTTAGNPGSVIRDLTYGVPPEFGGTGYRNARYSIPSSGIAADADLFLTFGDAVPGSIDRPGTFVDGTPVRWTEYKVLSYIFMDGVARLPAGGLPLPAVSFQSPTVQGKAFSVSLADRTLRDSLALEPDCSLNGMKVSIAGGPDLTGWRSFASFRNAAGGITLILDTDTQVAVTPDLDPARAVNVNWGDLLAEWGLTGTPTHLSGHLGHHSYPEDRAYLLLQSATTYQWIAFGEWDAYRDVSAERWSSLGLAKPRSRKLYKDGLARPVPIQTPPRPAHGLALYDVFAPQAGS